MIALGVGLFSFIFFLFFQATGIYGGDSGDMVTSAVTFGVAHPPGYPLYTFVGWLFSHIPLYSPSWRVGLLSSIPHSLTLVFVYLSVYKLTRSKFAGLLSAALLLSTYLFFLYSTTAEVFALFSLFIAIVTYILILLQDQFSGAKLITLVSILGLSLSHHHVIVFLFPGVCSFFYAIRRKIARISIAQRIVGGVLFLFFAIVPYFYLFVAANGSSMVNWNRPNSLIRIFQTITRQDYGTFVSNAFYIPSLSYRLTQIYTYANFVYDDFHIFGAVCSLVGLYVLVKRKQLFWYFAVSLLLLGPFFVFYASFPLVNEFTLGTFERFLLPSYILISILAGVGLSYCFSILTKISSGKSKLFGSIPVFFVAGAIIIPVYFIGIQAVRFKDLRNDTTADFYGRDVLNTLKPQSILFLQNDTPLFITEYMRYAANYRTDTFVFHYSRLEKPAYQEVMKKVFPLLSYPKEGSKSFEKDFISQNFEAHPIYSSSPFPISEPFSWVPRGLLYELVLQEKYPESREIRESNSALWNTYQNPLDGILSHYRHLMLWEIASIYANAKLRFAWNMFRFGFVDDAKKALQDIQKYEEKPLQTSELILEGSIAYKEKRCDDAIQLFQKSQLLNDQNSLSLGLIAMTYRDCKGDMTQYSNVLEKISENSKMFEQPLNPSK